MRAKGVMTMPSRFEYYREMVMHLTDGVLFVDTNNKITLWNHAMVQWTGISESDAIGKTCCQILTVYNVLGQTVCPKYCLLTHTLGDNVVRRSSVYLLRGDGSGNGYQVLTHTYPLLNVDGDVDGALQIYYAPKQPQVEAGQMAEKLKTLTKTAYVDMATGLFNKSYMAGKLEQLVIRYREHQEIFGVTFISVVQFERINEQYGQAGGDRALKEIAAVLANNVDATDSLGRWHGVNFLILSPQAKKSVLYMYAERIKSLVSQLEIEIQGNRVQLRVSAGCAFIQAGDSAITLLERANETVTREALLDESTKG